MKFLRLRGQKLRMAWNLDREGKRSFLAGTLRPLPLPHSFERSLRALMREAETVFLDPPALPDPPRERTGEPGSGAPRPSILGHLDPETVRRIARAVSPGCERPATPPFACMAGVDPESHLRIILHGLPDARAAVAACIDFLEVRGWTESLDREARDAALRAGREILPLRPAEEEALFLGSPEEDLALARLKDAPGWDAHARRLLDAYLEGDLDEALLAFFRLLPAPPHPVLDDHAERIFDRVRTRLEAGHAAAFVPLPLVPGVLERLRADGFAAGPRK
jgi:hypothetical protein